MSSNEEKKKQVIYILSSIAEDTSVPRNIRRAANEGITSMEDESIESLAIRASNAISKLDEISQDPNCPLYARTKIWNAVSVLETIKD
ncbi:MAG: UPF0147 family protein [Candidatus Helarchaeota archaeon]|nr:UPF0147 family protein [Candidatus Helarchaeota archaeon]